MAHFLPGTANARSVEAWLSVLTERLQELLGSQGAHAVLCKALVDARRQRPELSAVIPKQDGFDLSAFCSDSNDESAGNALGGEPLSVLAESLCLLLINLLGDELTSQIIPAITVNEGDSAAISYPYPFFSLAKKSA